MAREDKGRPVATWRRPLGEEVRRLFQGLRMSCACLHFFVKCEMRVKYHDLQTLSSGVDGWALLGGSGV